MSADALIFALPPVPRYGGRTPEKFIVVSGAQNLNGGSEFPPGHWALGLQKFRLVRSRWCAWLYRANAPSANPGGRPKGLPYPIPEEFFETVGAAISRPKAFPLLGGKVPSAARRMRVPS